MPSPLIVKFLSRVPEWTWDRYFADRSDCSRGNCRFVFDADAERYDWVVVYEQFPRPPGRSRYTEQLKCSADNTLLITTEPPSVKRYAAAFTRQFAHVLTTHPETVLPHPGRIWSQPGLRWFYGADGTSSLSRQQLAEESPAKSSDVSTVCSSKQQGHTLHRRRYEFVQDLRQRIPELNVFGHGVRPVADKATAVRPFRYHVAIENYVGRHHWTEKVADSFLGRSLLIYYGCPNLADYFPHESFLAIDIDRPDDAAETIKQAIRRDLFSRRLSAVLEARRLVLNEYDLFTVISRIIRDRHQTSGCSGGVLRSRHALRVHRPFSTIPTAIGSELRTLWGRVAGSLFR